MQLDQLPQGGRHPNVGVEQTLVGRVPRIDKGEDDPAGLDGNRRLEREVASGLPQSMDHGHVRVREPMPMPVQDVKRWETTT